MSRSVRFLVALLTVSVILNFALAGFLAASYVRNQVFQQFAVFTQAEPSPALRTAFQEALRSDRRVLLATLFDLRDARNLQHEILTAERLDSAALELAQLQTRNATDAVVEVLQRALRTAASELPDTERRAIPKLRASSLMDVGNAGSTGISEKIFDQ